jgi:CubicO group peptidase (beta-lactamase class C family)
MKTLFSFLFSLFLVPSIVAQPSETGKKSATSARTSTPVEQLDAEVQKAASDSTPGLAVVIVKDGKVVYRTFRGLAEIDSKTPISDKTPFYIASLSKQFTAMAIMMLEERGKLEYDDKVTKYFPEFTFAGDMTIRHLLTHTSGMIDHLDIVKDEVKGWTNADVVDLIKRENRVLFSPGEKVSYSNSGYVVLSMIVEKVSGQSFSQYLKKNVFDPLGMDKTFVATKGTKIPGRVVGLSSVDGKWSLNDYDAFTTGGGGIYSTLGDMEKWDRSFYEKPLINPETLKLASTANVLNNGKPTAYGFGWLAEFATKGDLANVWYVASFGNFKGFQAMHKRISERRFSVIVLSNGGKFPWNVMETAQALYTK